MNQKNNSLNICQRKLRIAIDAMGGENSPNKIIEGIKISLKSKENYFLLYGDEKDLIKKEILKDKNLIKHCEIINTRRYYYR